jgi:hypothetical protein
VCQPGRYGWERVPQPLRSERHGCMLSSLSREPSCGHCCSVHVGQVQLCCGLRYCVTESRGYQSVKLLEVVCHVSVRVSV